MGGAGQASAREGSGSGSAGAGGRSGSGSGEQVGRLGPVRIVVGIGGVAGPAVVLDPDRGDHVLLGEHLEDLVDDPARLDPLLAEAGLQLTQGVVGELELCGRQLEVVLEGARARIAHGQAEAFVA